MEHRKIILFTVATCLFMAASPMQADRYKVLFANSGNIKIGSQTARKGITFNDEDKITWTSEKQALKVLNLSTNRVMVIAQRGFERQRTKTLAEYLHKVRHLSTREYGTTSVMADTVCYLLDTLNIEAGKNYGKNVTDEVIIQIGDETITTKVQKTSDKKKFVLTRQIYGSKNPEIVYLDIVEIDKQRDWRYYVYRRLRVEPLPLNAD